MVRTDYASLVYYSYYYLHLNRMKRVLSLFVTEYAAYNKNRRARLNSVLIILIVTIRMNGRR